MASPNCSLARPRRRGHGVRVTVAVPPLGICTSVCALRSNVSTADAISPCRHLVELEASAFLHHGMEWILDHENSRAHPLVDLAQHLDVPGLVEDDGLALAPGVATQMESLAREYEKTLWKSGSPLGKFTVAPTGTHAEFGAGMFRRVAPVQAAPPCAVARRGRDRRCRRRPARPARRGSRRWTTDTLSRAHGAPVGQRHGPLEAADGSRARAR